ncbi:hypothetical protein ACROYT_G026773 [Oculina patagonica]
MRPFNAFPATSASFESSKHSHNLGRSRTSPVSTVSQTPPASPSESSTETHETTELSDEPNQSGKDASESEDKTDEEDDKDVPWHYKQPFKHRRRVAYKQNQILELEKEFHFTRYLTKERQGEKTRESSSKQS